MKGFKIDEMGDVVIENGVVQIVEDDELTLQKVQTVTGTKRGEWFNNPDEGIDFRYLLGKNVTDEMAYGQILSGLKQVDSDFYINEFSRTVDPKTRKAEIKYTAKNGSVGTTITTSTAG